MKKSLWVFVCLTALTGFLLIRLFSPTSVRATTGSLAALWHFDEGAGTSAFDSSGNGNVGVLTGAPLPTWTSGKFETAINFDGLDDFVQVADTTGTLDIPGSLTVEAWINATSFGTINAILSKENSTVPFNVNYNFHVLGGKLFFGLTFNGTAAFASGTGGCDPGCFVTGATPVSTGVFHHVAGVYDNVSKTLGVYLDGVLDGTATFTTTANPFTNADPVLIGTRNAGITFFSGVIDEVRIWNRALAANEILAIAQAGLHALWHFNEASSSAAAADSSGYQNNATVSGASFVAGQTNFGNALSFNGSDGEAVTVPDASSLQLTGSFAIEAWVKPSSTPAGFHVIVAKWQNSDLNTAGIFFALNGEKLFARLSTTGSNFIDVNGATSVSTTAWHHVALVLDTVATKATLYLDGSPDGSTTNSAFTSVHGNNGIGVSIGSYNPFGTFTSVFNGVIDEVHFWARALSADEIAFIASSADRAELVVPSKIDQEFGSGAVFASEWDYSGFGTFEHAMGLEFIASNDDGSGVINGPSATPPCATDRGSTPGTPSMGGLVGCQIGIGGKSALITGKQMNVTVDSKTVKSKTLDIFVNETDGTKLGANFQWQ